MIRSSRSSSKQGPFLILTPRLFEPNRSEVHGCPCGRSFTTAQGLALHRVRAHQQFAPEHNLICGATCPPCLRFFWTSARLQQHLASIPRGGGVNICYQALTERGYTTEYQAIGAPKRLPGAVRLDALQTPGHFCLFSTTHEKEIAKVQELINSLEEELTINAAPADHLIAGQELSDRLSKCTRIWVERFRGGRGIPDHITDLGDWWLRLLWTKRASSSSASLMSRMGILAHTDPSELARPTSMREGGRDRQYHWRMVSRRIGWRSFALYNGMIYLLKRLRLCTQHCETGHIFFWHMSFQGGEEQVTFIAVSLSGQLDATSLLQCYCPWIPWATCM